MQHNKRKHKPHSGRGSKPAFSRELLARAAEMVARGELIPLKNDAAFKMFLSGPTPESNACLRSMLSALTGRVVTSAKVTNAELLPEYATGKKPRLDVNCEFDDGQKADIELQLRKEDDDQKLRALFYACKLYAGSLKHGEQYKKAPSVYQIFLIDFDLFEEDNKPTGRQFYHRAMMRLDDKTVFSDRLQIRFFSLKVPDRVDKSLQKAANWCSFIAGNSKPEVLERLGKDSGWKEDFKMALNTAIRLSAEERAWAYHLSMDRAEADYRNGIKYARLDALEEGRKNALFETARNMLADGLLPEKIAQYTGLSLTDVEQLTGQSETPAQ